MSSVTREALLSSFNEEMFNILQDCMNTTSGIINFGTFFVTCGLLVIPVRVFVVCITIQRLLQGSSVAVSHSEHFAFHMSVCELLCLAGLTLSVSGAVANCPQIGIAGLYLLFSLTCVQILFDTVTCVERYLAVCHPITFRNLKNAKGAQIRNVTVGLAWSWSLLLAVLLSTVDTDVLNSVYLTLAALSLVIVLLCSLSVLFALIRPGPGEARPVRLQLDQSKLRAFVIILVILALLFIRIGGSGILSAFSNELGNEAQCHLMLYTQWLRLPHGLLVLGLLLSQKTQK